MIIDRLTGAKRIRCAHRPPVRPFSILRILMEFQLNSTARMARLRRWRTPYWLSDTNARDLLGILNDS